MDAGVDQQVLRNEAYRSSRDLQARASIYSFEVDPIDFPAWVLDQAPWAEGDRVLDVGCGPGTYLEQLTARGIDAVGLDLSEGMAGEARRSGAAAAVGDAGRLPVRSGAVDGVLAAHMLYHCPDVDAAVAELARVIRPGGALVAVTNGEGHVFRALLADVVGQGVRHTGAPFTLENGAEVLGRHFTDVELVRRRGELAITEAGPPMTYLRTLKPFYEPQLTGFRTWRMVEADVEDRVRTALADDGEFRVPTDTGVLVATTA